MPPLSYFLVRQARQRVLMAIHATPMKGRL